MSRRNQQRQAATDQPLVDPPATHEDDPLLSLTDVGKQMGKSPQTVRRWCVEGLIAHVRLPSGRLEVRQSVVDRFLVGTGLVGQF